MCFKKEVKLYIHDFYKEVIRFPFLRKKFYVKFTNVVHKYGAISQ